MKFFESQKQKTLAFTRVFRETFDGDLNQS